MKDLLGDVRNAFGVKTIHHALDDVQLILNTKVDEICIWKEMNEWNFDRKHQTTIIID